MSLLGSLSPFLEDENQFVSFGFGMPVGSPPALSWLRELWTRCPFCTSTLKETFSAETDSFLCNGQACGGAQ